MVHRRWAELSHLVHYRNLAITAFTEVCTLYIIPNRSVYL